MGRTAIGGYAEAHAIWERADGAIEHRGFVAKRFNLFTATEVSDFIRIGAELEFEDGAEEIKLEYAAIDFAVHQSFTLRAGMILSPIGRFNLAHDSPLNEFTDRPIVSTELLGTALSEPGLGALGVFPLGGVGRLTYEVYAVNGFHDGLITRSADGTRIPQGRGNFEDNNASPAVVGRVAWSPALDLEFGLSAHHGAYNVFNVDGLAVEPARHLTIIAVDAEGEVAGIQLRGEVANAAIDVSEALDGVYASGQRGLYTEAIYNFGRGVVSTMPNSHFSAGARIDVVDFDIDLAGDTARRLTLGFNFRPTAETVLKFDYFRGQGRDRFNSAAEEAGVQFSLATYF
jgi:hypothetical protein